MGNGYGDSAGAFGSGGIVSERGDDSYTHVVAEAGDEVGTTISLVIVDGLTILQRDKRSAPDQGRATSRPDFCAVWNYSREHVSLPRDGCYHVASTSGVPCKWCADSE